MNHAADPIEPVQPVQPVVRPGGFARNTLNLVLGQVVTTALTIVLGAVVARTLGPSDFGVVYLVTSVATFAYVFVDWGHGAYVIREVARRPERTGEVMGTVMVLRAATAVALVAPSVFGAWLLGYDRRTLFLVVVMMTAWLPMYLGLTYGWAFRGRERMEFDALINVVLKALALAIGVLVLAQGGRVVALFVSTGVAGTITLIVAVALYRRLGFPAHRVTRSMARELMIGGAPMVSMTIAVAVQPYIDANLLSWMSPQNVLGWYGAAVTFANTLVAPAAVLSSAAYPRLSVAAHDRVRFANILHEALRPLLFVAVLGGVGTYLFAEVGVGIVYSLEKFSPTASILRAFAPAMVLIFIDMMLATAIIAAGRATSLAVAKIIAVVTMTALELILIPICQARFGNGGLGVMFAFAGSEAVMIAAALYLMPGGVLSRAIFIDVMRAAITGAGTLLVIQMILRWFGPSLSMIGVPICILVFAGLAFAVGLITRNDIAIVSRLVRRRDRGERA